MNYAMVSKLGNRDNNEDSITAIETDIGSLFVVADGLGGHGKGEVASAIVTETFQNMFKNCSDTEKTSEFIAEAFNAAQSNIVEAQVSQNALDEMKTTCAALLVCGNFYVTGHVGDTRIYTFLNNKVKERTRDHSVAEMLAISGDIKEKKIRHHPDRNRLLRTMGITWNSPLYELTDDIQLSECQAFLLCTDGFWELCDEKKMCTYLKKSSCAEEWLNLMTVEVEKNGKGKDMDNYSAIAVSCR